MNKSFIRILIFTIILAIIDVILFSPGLVALNFTLYPVWFILAIILNVGVLGGEVVYLSKSSDIKYGYDLDKLNKPDDYKNALMSVNTRKIPFKVEIEKAIEQLNSLEKKEQVLNELLEQNNKQHYSTLYELSNQAKQYMLNNVRKILNRVAIYDTVDSNDMSSSEHKEYINKLLLENDNIIKQFNKLLTEVSMLDDQKNDDTLSNVLEDVTNSLKQMRGE